MNNIKKDDDERFQGVCTLTCLNSFHTLAIKRYACDNFSIIFIKQSHQVTAEFFYLLDIMYVCMNLFWKIDINHIGYLVTSIFR
jgi:hypothetical protein